jgi:hypothetical protein
LTRLFVRTSSHVSHSFNHARCHTLWVADRTKRTCGSNAVNTTSTQRYDGLHSEQDQPAVPRVGSAVRMNRPFL